MGGTQKRPFRLRRVGSARLAAIGASAPRQFRLLKRKLTIGSASDNELVIVDGTVSRRHALLKRRRRRYRLIDLKSTNGTFVNGGRVTRPTLLRRGDELRFGAVRFVFLESPGTRELRKRISLSTLVALLLVTFAMGFASTEHFINRALIEGLAVGSRGQSTLLANSTTEREKETTPHALASAPSSKPALVRPVLPDSAPPFATTPAWLQALNHWRVMAGVPPIREDPDAARGATAHARYMVKNYLARNPDTPHHEEPSNPWYTPEGAKAAPNGNEYGPGPGPPKSPTYDIDGWMDGPFHRLGLIERDLTAAGYGHHCESGVCGEVLVLDSRSQAETDPTWFGEFPQPVMFPSNGATLPGGSSALIYGEWPEPLSCPGYMRPAGYPITLQFDQRFVPKLVSFTLSCNGVPVSVCGYDSTGYINGDPATQAWGRDGLKGQGAIVLIPKKPLEPGATYTVSVAVQGQSNPWGWGSESPLAGQMRRYEWSFSVGNQGGSK